MKPTHFTDVTILQLYSTLLLFSFLPDRKLYVCSSRKISDRKLILATEIVSAQSRGHSSCLSPNRTLYLSKQTKGSLFMNVFCSADGYGMGFYSALFAAVYCECLKLVSVFFYFFRLD